MASAIAEDLKRCVNSTRFCTVLADPPWQFQNRTGKMAPEHKRLSRYGTLQLPDILSMPLSAITADTAHLYLWVPNALLPWGLQVMEAWGFEYKSNIVWHKIRKDGGPDGRGVGFYFRNTTELILFGVRGKNARTLAPGRRQVNIIKTQKREHSRKPDELYDIIEACSPGPYLELFARGPRKGWRVWGDQSEQYEPTWPTYANHSGNDRGTKDQARLALPDPPVLRKKAKANGHAAPEKMRSPKPVQPQTFIERALRAAPGQSFGATAAYDEYVRQCQASKAEAIHQLAFWRMLSVRAADLGIRKSKAGGRVVYADATLSTAA